uniref:Uncharacterized protein n=1 Tax=Arundo donax TaxID=35708 RepID=A0A0A9ASW2_ARUDO
MLAGEVRGVETGGCGSGGPGAGAMP